MSTVGDSMLLKFRAKDTRFGVTHWRELQADFVWCRLELRFRRSGYFPWLVSLGEPACTSARPSSLR